MTTVSTIEITVAGQRLSGRAAEPDGAPRAVVFALHGGSYSSRYFDLRAGQRSSALQNCHCLDAHRACYAHHLATAAFFETCRAAR